MAVATAIEYVYGTHYGEDTETSCRYPVVRETEKYLWVLDRYYDTWHHASYYNPESTDWSDPSERSSLSESRIRIPKDELLAKGEYFHRPSKRYFQLESPVKNVQKGRLPGCLQHLGFEQMPTESELNARYRKLAFENHPDQGGSTGRFKIIQIDYEAAQKLLGGAKPRREPPPKPKNYMYVKGDAVLRFPIVRITSQSYWFGYGRFDTWKPDLERWSVFSERTCSPGGYFKLKKREILKYGFADSIEHRLESEKPPHVNENVDVPECFYVLGHRKIPTFDELIEAHEKCQKFNKRFGESHLFVKVEEWCFEQAKLILRGQKMNSKCPL